MMKTFKITKFDGVGDEQNVLWMKMKSESYQGKVWKVWGWLELHVGVKGSGERMNDVLV